MKPLTAQYKKLMKEDTRTGSNTEDAISYPAEGRLVTACFPAVEGAVEDSDSDDVEPTGSQEANALHGDVDPGNVMSRVKTSATSVSRTGKRLSVFSPIMEAPTKRSKKDADLSTLASSMTTLVDHIVGKSPRHERGEMASDEEDLVLMHQRIVEMGGRVTDMDVKIDAVAETIPATVTKAVLGTITSILMPSNSSSAFSSTWTSSEPPAMRESC
ncbi:hypothetical protein PC129_g19082 [Phytophthora cactorum]|nr:hypothetical protein Pcac1_g28281 [Phytophthora cactorum]KAG2799908.1 hypothetical protein PC111_g20206 [Phytophthora cactorum]KAG2805199.1 hypothetical protein PC112_g18370 [Phytophthora cactorum]KAG2834047.1 hypothetical protein PC113_g20464 [Phytophthora cactorum]KAG2878133.1 hypothetical protein PC114_g23275 [Phytophthora cactorum]